MDVYPKWALPPILAMVAVAIALAALVGGIVACVLRARRRGVLAAAAERSVGDRRAPLVDGAEVVLSGIVRHHEHEVAVKVRVHQKGSESESSGSWSHSWIEIDREIELAPFLLELATGELVVVHPPKNVDVADALDQKVWIDRNHRVLSAELVPGEQIFARGRLERSDQAAPTGAYREVSWGWALVPSDGQMLLSSEPLGAGLRQRARFHTSFALWAATLLLVTNITLIAFYGRLLGHTELAKVTAKHFYQTTDSDGDTYDHYALVVRGADNEVADDDYKRITEQIEIPIRIGSGSNWKLGSSATLAWWHALIELGFASLFWLPYKVRRRSSRPWFRRKVNESGSGQLPDPPRA